MGRGPTRWLKVARGWGLVFPLLVEVETLCSSCGFLRLETVLRWVLVSCLDGLMADPEGSRVDFAPGGHRLVK